MNSAALHGLIGDTRSAALIAPDGALDWLCVPRFDSDPIFGALVDPAHGGRWRLAPAGGWTSDRRYVPNTATLLTRWETSAGTAESSDTMIADVSSSLRPQIIVVRILRCTAGSIEASVLFSPRAGLPGKAPAKTSQRSGRLICEWGAKAVALQSHPHVDVQPGTIRAIGLGSGEQLVQVLSFADRGPLVFLEPQAAIELVRQDEAWWRRWIAECTFEGPHPDAVHRSLITLRLLTYSPAGAPVAAPTTSLPAGNAERAWDYRYCWPRDAGISTGVMHELGAHIEPRAFLRWLIRASRISRPQMDVAYSLTGKRAPGERTADVEGVVRVGNDAHLQHQLDVYGWVLDAAWLLVRDGLRLDRDTARGLAGLADLVCSRWQAPDHGIWEIRMEPVQYVHSKLMGWVALDRAIRIAGRHGPMAKRIPRWFTERDHLAAAIRARGFDDGRGTYTRAFGDSHLDAALLILPMLEFEPEGSPRVLGTVQAIRQELSAGGPLLYRYPPGTDGLPGAEGAFLPCSFWLAQALARLGRIEEASEVFSQLCGFGGPVGLLPEQIDPSTKLPTGNYPLALTHATLLQAATAISRATESRRALRHTPHARPA